MLVIREELIRLRPAPKKTLLPNSGQSKDPAVPDPPEEPKEPEEVPDILYCLDYRDFAGDLIQRKKDSKPIDVNSLAKAKDREEIVVEKKPVLEIVTEITAQVNRPRRRYPAPRRRSPSPYLSVDLEVPAAPRLLK